MQVMDFQHHFVPRELAERRGANDTCATLQRRYPDRFVGLAHLPLLIDKSALAEPDRAIRELGLRGVFATDYPEDFTGATTDTRKGVKDIRKYIEEIRALPFPEDTKAGMLGGTAAELLGLPR